MALNKRKHTVPAGSEVPARAAILGAFESVNDIVPVANTTERAAVATAIAPSTSRPLVVWRADAPAGQNLETTTNGTTWATIKAGDVAGKMWRTGTGQNLTTTLTTIGMDSSRTTGGITFDDANDQLVLSRDGIFQAIVHGTVSGGTTPFSGYFALQRVRSGTTPISVPTPTFNKAGISDERCAMTHELPFQNGDRLALQVVSSAATGAAFASSEYYGCSLTVTYVRPLNGATPV